MNAPVQPIPEPPWWQVHPRGKPRSGLTRESIVSAAVEVLDEAGIEGLSMRRVAEHLGTGAASLYWHIADKEQLIHLVLDRVIGEIELPKADPTRWRDQIHEYAIEARTMFQRHRGVALASLGRVPMGPNLIRVGEWALAVLRGAGVPDRPAAWFADLIALVGTAQAVEDVMASAGGDRVMAGMERYMAMLPPDQFPNLTEVATEMASGSPDDRFEFSIELLLRGIETYIEPRRL
jgi:AcrR family transcriptional regulator